MGGKPERRNNGIAAVAGDALRGVLGYGRSKQDRPAGLRTYMLVCVAAAKADALTDHVLRMPGIVSVIVL